jgi:hypothetical protein
MLKKLAFVSNNKSSVFLLVLALIVGGVGAQATGLLSTASVGYLVCAKPENRVITHFANSTTAKCPKGFKKVSIGARGIQGVPGLTGATGLPGINGVDGKDGKTLWNGVKDPESTLGAPGDMFINSVTKTLFGPKNLDGSWPAGVSMVGPPGAAGVAGPAGPPGSNATLTCAQGGTCVIGDTGPGGGKVFYVQTATPAAPWRYLEAAPNTWSGGSSDPTMSWCSEATAFVPNLSSGDALTVQTTVAIGAGYANTQKMLRGCTFGAANAAASYNGGGKSDWFLPSRDELTQLYEERTTVGGFGAGVYWSSSENEEDNAWFRAFSNGFQIGDNKSSTNSVRPVRAF